MTEALYLKNAYLKEFEATVTKVTDGRYIVLDKTAFYPVGGGQVCDTGVLVKDGKEYPVVFVKKFGNDISHEVENFDLKEGDKITGKIDWERRYKLMRGHTAMHLVTKVLEQKTGALITGNNIDVDKSRVDMNLDNLDREMVSKCFDETNEIIKKDLKVEVSFVSKEEALKDDSLVRLANRDFIERLGDEVRIVSIGDFDKQMDGGTHVHSTKEIGSLKMLKMDNRGKNNRRVYFELV